MRLTEVLFRMKKRLPHGHIWRGKYRLYREVKPKHLVLLKRQYDLEEKNMFYLRHPYLTPEQSNGHMEALYGPVLVDRPKKTWKTHSYLGDRLGFLKVTDKWE